MDKSNRRLQIKNIERENYPLTMGVSMDFGELIGKARNVYNEALELYERGDFIDAAEMALFAI